MKICHIGILPLEQMGCITRDIYYRCIGEHHYSLLGNEPQKADIYILHCFKKHHEEFRDWKPPVEGAKVISILHSSPPCEPAKCSDMVVVISHNQWNQVFDNCFLKNHNLQVIKPGIEHLWYTSKLNRNSIIKISRGEPGKFHPEEGKAIDEIVRNTSTKYSLICNRSEKVKDLLPKSANIIDNIGIGDNEDKANILAKHGIYADAHGDFEDTFCIALLEAMSAGLACVIMRDGNNFVLDEVLGHCGIITNTIGKFKLAVEALVKDDNVRALYGNLARVRAKEYFSVERMIAEWNQLIINTLS